MIKSSLLKEFMETGKCRSCPVIDMHQHMGPFQGIYLPNSSAEAMIRTMDRCGVKTVSYTHLTLPTKRIV